MFENIEPKIDTNNIEQCNDLTLLLLNQPLSLRRSLYFMLNTKEKFIWSKVLKECKKLENDNELNKLLPDFPEKKKKRKLIGLKGKVSI